MSLVISNIDTCALPKISRNWVIGSERAFFYAKHSVLRALA